MSINYNYNVIEAVSSIGGRGVTRGGVIPLSIDYIIVGGGGAGGINGGVGGYIGGGAGGFRTGSMVLGLNDTFTIEVGHGGIPGGRLPSGSAMRNNVYDLFVSGAGAPGVSGWPQQNTYGTGSVCGGGGRYYGAGGGGGMSIGYDAVCSPTTIVGAGGDAIAWFSSSFAGGGGGGVIEVTPANVYGGAGGTSVSGSSGGDGGSYYGPSSAGRQFSGGGGGAAGNNNGAPASEGASGSVVIRYPYYAGDIGIAYATGGVKYIYNGYVYHRFESNGTFQTFAS